MYLPAYSREERIEVHHDLIRAHPLGLLVTAGPRGLMANPLPFLIDSAAAPKGTLRAHISRANPQAAELEACTECMVVFQGPHGYVTPSWYATKRETGKVVPTWNYATVHVWGRPRTISDPEWIHSQIADLTASREEMRAEPWSVGDAPAAFLEAQIRGILGISIEISRSEGKWKAGQNETLADRRGVIEGFREEGEGGEAMARLVEERAPESRR
jgi:transcriptional regulator